MDTSLINWTLNSLHAKTNVFEPPLDFRAEITGITELPPLPGISARILRLSSDPLADSSKLAEIIELDPLLTTQIIRWASSPLYGYKGKIVSVKDAITRVLGYQFVFDLVLGLASLSPLKAPKEGVIGTRAFWTHALASTHLMKEVNNLLPDEHRMNPQTVFLVALMHNIGLPLLGHKFVDKFRLLTQLIEANPSLSIVKMEQFAFGVDHCELGSLLLKTWSLPNAIIDVVYHHHNPHYLGENYQLNLITYLNDCLLAQLNIGDGQKTSDYDQILNKFNLTNEHCHELLEKLESDLEKIKGIVGICTDM